MPGPSLASQRKLFLVAFVSLLLPSCDEKTLPTAPSDLSSGLTIYEHANYLGSSALVTQSLTDLQDFTGPCEHESSGGPPTYVSSITFDWNDCISSIRIAPGWHGVVYRDGDYHGDSLEVTGDVPNLQLVRGDCEHDGMNDCITSIRLIPPR